MQLRRFHLKLSQKWLDLDVYKWIHTLKVMRVWVSQRILMIIDAHVHYYIVPVQTANRNVTNNSERCSSFSSLLRVVLHISTKRVNFKVIILKAVVALFII